MGKNSSSPASGMAGFHHPAHALLEQRITRYRQFFDSPESGQLLVQICPYTFDAGLAPGTMHKDLRDWNPHTEAKAMAENSVMQLRHFMSLSEQIGCDYIPQLGCGYGIGMNSAYLTDADVIPGVDTSWVHPVLSDWSDFKPFAYDPDNRWVKYIMTVLDRYHELNDGDFMVASVGHFAPADMANAIRGNDFFYDLHDEPEKLSALLDQCAEAILSLHWACRKKVPLYAGGTAAAAMWFPGDCLFLSEDASDLVSAELYREHLRPHTQKILNAVGGGYIHHHAKGWHIHASITQLNHLQMVEISWDPKCPRPVDHLEEIAALSLKVPFQTRCTVADVYRNIDTMKQCRLSLMVNAENLREATEVTRFIRNNSRL